MVVDDTHRLLGYEFSTLCVVKTLGSLFAWNLLLSKLVRQIIVGKYWLSIPLFCWGHASIAPSACVWGLQDSGTSTIVTPSDIWAEYFLVDWRWWRRRTSSLVLYYVFPQQVMDLLWSINTWSIPAPRCTVCSSPSFAYGWVWSSHNAW